MIVSGSGNLGIRDGFGDIAATAAEAPGVA